jgi:hypothetical protein
MTIIKLSVETVLLDPANPVNEVRFAATGLELPAPTLWLWPIGREQPKEQCIEHAQVLLSNLAPRPAAKSWSKSSIARVVESGTMIASQSILPAECVRYICWSRLSNANGLPAWPVVGEQILEPRHVWMQVVEAERVGGGEQW